MHEELSPRLTGADRHQAENSQGDPKPGRDQCRWVLTPRSQVTSQTESNQKTRKYQCYLCQAETSLTALGQDTSWLMRIGGLAMRRMCASVVASVGYAPTHHLQRHAPG